MTKATFETIRDALQDMVGQKVTPEMLAEAKRRIWELYNPGLTAAEEILRAGGTLHVIDKTSPADKATGRLSLQVEAWAEPAGRS